jgi:lipoprotein-releasing system permease protein
MLSWKIFNHYLLSRRSGAVIRTVSWMSMAGICVGVAALIIVVSVMNGFNEVIRERHLRVEPHLVAQAPDGVNYVNWLESTRRKITEVLGSEVHEVTPFSTQDVILKTIDGYFAGAIAKGLDANAITAMVHRIEEKSSVPSIIPRAEQQEDALNLEPGEVLIGDELGDALRVVPGDKVVLIPPESLLLPVGEAPPMQTVTVRGTFRSQLADVDGKLIIYDRTRSLRALMGTASQGQGVELRLQHGQQYERAQSALAEVGIPSESWPQRNSALFFALKMEKMAMTIFLALSALITSFSIVTVLVLLVTQKRKDIGILMAMGLNQRQTQMVFAQVGIWLSSIGLVAGILLGVIVCKVIDTYPMDILPAIYYDRTIPAKVSPFMILVIVVFAGIISIAGSWFPAYLSARGSPAEALRGAKDL